MIANFKRSAHLYLDHTPDKELDFEWLSVMQHFGAPTRLLDFSFSPYVGLFFALSGMKQKASVYCVKFKDIKEIDEATYDDVAQKYDNIMAQNKVLDNTVLLPFEPRFTNQRLLAQQGAFLIPNTLNYSHDKILECYDIEGNDEFVYKLNISETATIELIENLAKMNISYATIFPGIEGFCRSFETIGIIPISRFRSIYESGSV